MTGVQQPAAAASPFKQLTDELGYIQFSKVNQAPLEAEKIAEPMETERIDILEALPPEDATYYACQENRVERADKCELFFKDAEARSGFVGGRQ